MLLLLSASGIRGYFCNEMRYCLLYAFCPTFYLLTYLRLYRLHNCRNAMETATQHFGIPQVLRAENLSSRELDELSCMTYLSYFMKVDSPGYDETLRWVRHQLPSHSVRNFQVAFRVGHF